MNMQNIRMLIAEDDYLVAEEIKRTLKESNFVIVGEANNGKDAIELTANLKPDVVLMDITMPQMNGLEATVQIQEQCPTPVVILTAHESKDLLEEASRVGAGAYLTKPPKLVEIERVVSIALARHQDLMKLKRLNADLEKALSEIKTLRGILPICSFCKSIRNDEGYYEQLESYLQSHSDIDFSHTVCPSCIKLHYPDVY